MMVTWTKVIFIVTLRSQICIFLTGKPTIFVGLNMEYERKNKNDAKLSDLSS